MGELAMEKKAKRTVPHRRTATKATQTDRNLSVKIVPRGPDVETINAVSRAVLEHPTVRSYLKRARHQLFSTILVEPESEVKPRGVPAPPKRYQTTIYDYTHNRTVLVDGQLDDRQHLEVTESAQQPLPSADEFRAAVKILLKDTEVGPAIREKRLQPYPPMPPLVNMEQPDGRVERTIAVGLLPSSEGVRHEIVGVNMIRQTVTHFEGGAPEGSAAHNPICGIRNAGQATAAHGTPGQVWVTVTQGGIVLWKFLAVRPAASSGTNSSGIELRYVDYRGKRVLYRAHVPILNVKYDPGGCGCYRDWQYEEGMLQATGTNVAPGFRLCSTPATTILDTGSDSGNFLGVAIYVNGLEVVLVSEMQAGWYRYVSEWRLHADGTIRPRFGFSAVQSSCVCTRHHHHVYWRFDFDIRTPGNNRVREYNQPPLFPPSNWHNKNFEIMRFRDPGRQRKWRVENTVTGEGYDVLPGANDGVATASPDWPFPRGDVWILHYRGSEIDDGVIATGPPCEAGLNTWVNGEPIYDQDVVIWYGAHFVHDIAHEPPGTFGDIVGPDLKPINW